MRNSPPRLFILIFLLANTLSGFSQPLNLPQTEVDRLKQNLFIFKEDTNRVFNL